jgi:ATP-dependent DNA helicase PIF1
MDIRQFFGSPVKLPTKPKAVVKKIKVYAVKHGLAPGIYDSWADCLAQTSGVPGAKFKSFETREEADAYMAEVDVEEPSSPIEAEVDDMPSPFNKEQQEAYDAILSGKNIFLTGPGGTGKSFLLRMLNDTYQKKTGRKLYITAMTGCAALLLGPFAKTLHSWAGIGLGKGSAEELIATIGANPRKKKMWTSTQCLVIDEVSMMTPQLLETLDTIGRTIRKNGAHLAFGGMQVVLVGDFFQLPPVAKGASSFAFESPLWPRLIKQTIQLKTIVRQKDVSFQTILNEARIGKLSDESYATLAQRKTSPKVWRKLEIKPTMLFTRNADVSAINDGELSKLDGEEYVFEVKTKRTAYLPKDVEEMIVSKLDKDAPYEKTLILKKGAQVMLICNNPLDEKLRVDMAGNTVAVKEPIHGLVNGSRGIITDFSSEGYPIVRFLHGPTSPKIIRPHAWEAESLAREQIPLILAYAITIHKAQGATLDSTLIDVGPSTFEYGQAYVALSRARSLESIYIHDIDPTAFRAHPKVAEFYASLEVSSTGAA